MKLLQIPYFLIQLCFFRLGNCEVCAKEAAKYTCPRCEIKTCCLQCNKIHKGELECNGQRDKAKFIQMNKFTNLDLQNDYRFMEEVSRFVGNSQKESKFLRGNFKRTSATLQRQALKRGITLRILPQSFTRHKANTTKFDVKRQIIDWHVDWVFVNSEHYQISEETVPENIPLGAVLDKYLNPEQNSNKYENLQYYQAAGIPNIKLLLKAEQRSKGRFFEIDFKDTLKDALRNKTIVEYPTIHLVFKDHSYDIIDSDDEEAQISNKSGERVINNIIKRSEMDSSGYDSQQNLLFISDCSDDDDTNQEPIK